MAKTELKIDGMTCGHCLSAVERALRSQPGVQSASVDLAKGSAEIEHDPSTIGPEALVRAVEEEGYQAEQVA